MLTAPRLTSQLGFRVPPHSVWQEELLGETFGQRGDAEVWYGETRGLARSALPGRNVRAPSRLGKLSPP